MLSNVRLKLALLFWKLQNRLLRYLNAEEFEVRKSFVRNFLHDYLPLQDPTYVGKAILEDAIPNYFLLSGNRFPKFDFMLPELSIFVVVFGIESASWEEASLRGVSRDNWETCQRDLAIFKTEVPKLKTKGWAHPSKLLLVTWSTPISNESLMELLKDAK